MNRPFVVTLALIVAFLVGWFSARHYYTPAVEAPTTGEHPVWHGGACTPDVHHLVLPTPEGEKVIICNSSEEDVIAVLGPPDQQHSAATAGGQRTLLLYFSDHNAAAPPRAWLVLSNGKLLSAYALAPHPVEAPTETE